jgi:hypothetical protein
MKSKLHLLAVTLLVAPIGTGFAQPIITDQFQNQTDLGGTTATFFADADGTLPKAISPTGL